MAVSPTKPLRADARRNREAVLAAAREVFATDGPAAQIDDVAARAGVGIGTVYRHFPTKELLLTEIARERFRAFAEHARAALEIDEPFEAFATMLRTSAESVADNVAFQVAMMDPDRLDWEGIESDREALDAVARQLVDRAQAAGQLRADFRSEEIGTVMCGVTATMYFNAGSLGWRRHLEILLDGLRAR